ncbi:unnamed protein product [Ascophyllum nodosum]
MEGNVQQVVKQVSKFDGKDADDFREWSSKLRVSLSLYSKPIFKIVRRSQRPSDLDNDQATAREGRDDVNHNLFSILYFITSGPAFSVVQRFEGKTQENGVGHGQDSWTALHKKFDDYSREALRAAHREIKTVKMRSDKDPDDCFYKKDWCRDRLHSVTPKEGRSDRQYEDIICSAFHQSTTGSTRPTLRERIATLQIFSGLCRRSTPTTSPAPTPTRQEVSRDVASPSKRRGGTSVT